jgi:hypothetical protein
MTLELMESELRINWEVICENILEDFGKRICGMFVPHSLRDELVLLGW